MTMMTCDPSFLMFASSIAHLPTDTILASESPLRGILSHLCSIQCSSGSSKDSDPTSFIRFPFLYLGSLFHFHSISTLILLLLSYAQIVTRLTIPLHLSSLLLHIMLDTPDPLIEQGTSSSRYLTCIPQSNNQSELAFRLSFILTCPLLSLCTKFSTLPFIPFLNLTLSKTLPTFRLSL